MELKKVIVVLYGKEKHEIISNGIKAHLAGFSKEYDIVSINDEAFITNYSAVFKRKFYTFCQRNANWLYSVYSNLSEKKSLRIFNKQKRKIEYIQKTGTQADRLKKKVAYVKNILLRFNPVAVVCLTPSSLKLALLVREMYGIDTKVISFMVDFGTDLRFLDLRCDKFFAANEEVMKKLLKHGISEDRVVVTGVPYADNIKETLNKAKCRAEFNIANDYPLVVLSGGRYGSLCVIDDFNRILESICQFNFIALTGGNKKMGALMKAIKNDDEGKNIQVLDEADMKKLLTAADIFVTVPTTDDVLNGIIYGCAVIVTNPLSMIEKSNYAFFKHSGIARCSRNAHTTSLAVTELLLEEKEKKKLTDAAKNYIRHEKETDTRKIIELVENKNDQTYSDVPIE